MPALTFNPGSPNLLASGGAADGELCIWDVAAPSAPTLYPPLRAPGAPPPPAPPGGDIAAAAWNVRVPHILAAASGSGAVTVWDLKKQRPVLALRDAGGRMRRPSAVAWSPDSATTLAVACADDATPVVQVWDLRSATAPLAELAGHARGVQGVSWCGADGALLLTAGADGRACLWDVSPSALGGGALLGEACPLGNAEPLTGCAWAPAAPGAFALTTPTRVAVASHAVFAPPGAAAADANGGYAYDGVGAGGVAPTSRALARAPAWLGRKASVAWGYGGRVVSVSANARPDPTTGADLPPRTIVVSSGPRTTGLTAAAAELGAALGGGGRAALAALAERRSADAAAAADADVAETWALLAALCADDPRAALPGKLGLGDAAAAPPPPPTAAAPVADSSTPPSAAAAAAPPPDAFDADGGASFFETLPPLPPAAATPRADGGASELGTPRPSTGGVAPPHRLRRRRPRHSLPAGGQLLGRGGRRFACWAPGRCSADRGGGGRRPVVDHPRRRRAPHAAPLLQAARLTG